jgi:hypothetical protein
MPQHQGDLLLHAPGGLLVIEMAEQRLPILVQAELTVLSLLLSGRDQPFAPGLFVVDSFDHVRRH